MSNSLIVDGNGLLPPTPVVYSDEELAAGALPYLGIVNSVPTPISNSVIQSPETSTLDGWIKRQYQAVAYLSSAPEIGVRSMYDYIIPANEERLCCTHLPIQSRGTTCPIDLGIVGRGSQGEISLIEIEGHQIVVKRSEVKILSSQLKEKPPGSVSNIVGVTPNELKLYQYIQGCIGSTDLSKLKYLASDEFTNESLIGAVLSSSGYNFLVRHYWSTHCEKNAYSTKRIRKDEKKIGINAMEYCDMGNLVDLSEDYQMSGYWQTYEAEYRGETTLVSLVKPEYVMEIFKQLLVGLYELQYSFQFTSGDLKPANVFLKSEPVSGTYYGMPIECPFTVKIGDYGKASLSLPLFDGTVLRLYSESYYADKYLVVDPFSIKESSTSDGVKYYKLDSSFTSIIYVRSRHMGLPFYQSYDFYTLVIGLMMIPSYHHIILGTDYLRQLIWDPLWLSEKEANGVLVRVQKKMDKRVDRSKLSFGDAVSILKGVRLRCDVITHVIRLITVSYSE